jgi:nucleotide-binding universal stress UspA family protein
MPLKPALSIHPKSILFATDLTPASENGLRHALALARQYGATLHLAHVVSSVGFTLAGPDAIAIADEVALRELHELEHGLDASGAFAGIKHDVAVRDGEVWPQIERLIDEDHVDMVVIGTHGRRGLGRLFLGSVAEQILRCAECPVVTVGPAFNRGTGVENLHQPRPIVFATDFKGASLQALPYAITFARERNVKLVLLHVIPSIPLPPDGHRDTADDVIARRNAAEAESLGRLKVLLHQPSGPLPESEFAVRFGDPAEEILKVAAEWRADAIAMGLHRSLHAQAVSHFRSTIAYEVVCGANCAVFTARD